MRVLVCGGRTFGNRGLVRSVLFQHLKAGDTLIHGGAPGADTIASEVCPCFVEIHKFPAEWAKHGRAAGPIRNQRMIDEGKPDLVVAFPGGRGTADMVARAKKAGIEVYEVRGARGKIKDAQP